IGVFFDITRLERLEQVRQEFLSNVSHELRTPLTSILAFVETLEEGAIDDAPNSRRFLSVIRKNAVRMHHLINDILALSSIESVVERFYRVDRARTLENGGTGLGLAIVKHLARAHGGEVSVQSTSNEGSTFTIELPRAETSAVADVV